MAAFSMQAESKAEEAKLPTFTYYYCNGWPLCNKITVIVNDLKKDKAYSGKINMKTISMTSPGSKEAVKEAKLTNHGIVGKDSAGKIVVTVDGHSYKKDKVLEALDKLLKPSK